MCRGGGGGGGGDCAKEIATRRQTPPVVQVLNSISLISMYATYGELWSFTVMSMCLYTTRRLPLFGLCGGGGRWHKGTACL